PEGVAKTTYEGEIEVLAPMLLGDGDALDVEEIDPRAIGEIVLVPAVREVDIVQRLEGRAVQRRPYLARGVGDLADVDQRDARSAVGSHAVAHFDIEPRHVAALVGSLEIDVRGDRKL